jgi:ABC-2 type transport system ATP-binding protein
MSTYKQCMNSVIELEGVESRRGSFLLSVPRLRVEAGSIVGLVGRNGAGKTTLLELLGGLRRADAGRVRTCGLDPVAELVAQRRLVALMQDDMPLLDLGVGALCRAVAPFYPSWDAALAEALVARFGLRPEQRVRAMSRGEGTRVRLLVSLAWRPKLVLLDEPGTGLDAASRRVMLAEVMDIVRDPERAVVLSSHQAEDVERIADRVVLLDGGRVVADGPTEEVVGEGRTLEQVLLAVSR